MGIFRSFVGPAVLIVAGLGLAACQPGMSTGGGPAVSTAPAAPAASSSTASASRSAAPATASASTRTAAVAGLKSYKVYNTTESLCAQTCKSESRCVNHAFSPIQTINGYVAGQCQLFSR